MPLEGMSIPYLEMCEQKLVDLRAAREEVPSQSGGYSVPSNNVTESEV